MGVVVNTILMIGHWDFPLMQTIYKVLIVLILLIFGGGGVFLATWDMPPPSQKVEKVIPNEKIFR
jgi:hypothetical protein